MTRTPRHREGKSMTFDLVRRYPTSSVWATCTVVVSLGTFLIDVLR